MEKEYADSVRSDCPVNFAVEMFGDKWSLLIIRDIVFWGKKTYREFLDSDEQIATNILASRLNALERNGILKRSEHGTDRRRDVYTVTEKGLDLIPVLVEMVAWSARNDCWQSIVKGSTLAQRRFVERAVTTKNKFNAIEKFKDTVRRGGHIFEGVSRTPNPRPPSRVRAARRPA